MLAAVAMAVAMAASPAAAAEPIKPVGPWVVEMAENLCLLDRRYDTPKGTVTLSFQPLFDLPKMELFLVSDDKSDSQYSGNATVVVGGISTFTAKYFSVRAGNKNLRVTRLTIDRGMMEGLRDGDSLRIDAKPIAATFAIVRPEKAMPAFRTCEADLKRSWGIDPDAPPVRPLDGNPARFFSSDSYPKEALSKGVYGRVVALLQITPQGTVEHCRILSSAGALLNDGTCKAAARITFKPAMGADGKPVASSYVLPVRWVMPGSPG